MKINRGEPLSKAENYVLSAICVIACLLTKFYGLAGLITAIFAICGAFSIVHDLRCWRYEKVAYRGGLTAEPPMSTSEQLLRLLLYLVLIIPFGFVMFSMLTPAT